MGEVKEVHVPDIGDFDEVDVIEVLVSSGDRVEPEDSLITLESDKATMDVPSPLAGTVKSVKVKAGDQVGEGALILTLEVSEEVTADDDSAADSADEKPAPAPERADEEEDSGESSPPSEDREAESRSSEDEREAEPADKAADDKPAEPPAHSLDPNAYTKVYASPSVRRFARQLGVDLTRVQGTGRKARILKEDVRRYVKTSLSEPAGGGAALPEVPVIDFTRFGEIEKVELTRIQKISGPRLQASWVNLPHVTQNDEADITELEAFRQEQKAAAKEEGISLTPLAFIMKAVVRALEEYPALNSSLDPGGEHLILKRYYHLGFAVDTPDGLVVPVLRDVDEKGVLEVARELGEISAVAREGKLKPAQIQGASFTISSLGSIGGSFFSPIINAPEVAILGVARSRMAPVWNGSEFEPRLMLPLSLSYDHRVVDGAMAVRFTTYLCRLLADIRRLML